MLDKNTNKQYWKNKLLFDSFFTVYQLHFCSFTHYKENVLQYQSKKVVIIDVLQLQFGLGVVLTLLILVSSF